MSDGMNPHLLRLYDGKPVNCSCTERTVFLGFDGQIFLCRKMGSIGNALTQPLDEIWKSDQKAAILQQMKNCDAARDTLGFRHH